MGERKVYPVKEAGQCPAPRLTPGEETRGFIVRRVEAVEDICCTAYEMEHLATGAKVLLLHGNDSENLFAVGFRTPPWDSTGIAHILEHSVLAGSERYPVKDAFNELSRATLQTFINAFTYPDKTLYPVASQVPVDYFNLARVYADLVFKPRILKETFLQEGHHLEFVNPDDPASDLSVSGIVYNEMKGAYSSPEALMYKALQQNLFPDNPYGFDSGGDPEVIPRLTWEQLREFHRLYYSPTNAYFFLYGSISPEDHLAFLEDILRGFGKVQVDSAIGLQPRWAKPRSVRDCYPVGKGESLARKTAVNLAWVTAENTTPEEVLLLTIAAHALVGTAAGPLRKALIDSGLGEDLSPVTGLESDLRQVVFAVGLRGTDPEKSGAIEGLVLKTLEGLAQKGFDRDLVEAALHQVEFHGKEIVRGGYPYGITLMGRVFHTWLYDGDPLTPLKFNLLIERIRGRLEKEPGLFQEVIRRWLLENPHRLASVMEPSHNCMEEQEAKFRQRMAKLKATLSQEDRNRIRDEASRLKALQTQPETPEALAALPRLKRSDIPRGVERIPFEEGRVGGIPVLKHEVFGNGIVYLDCAFDVSHVPEDLQPYLPLLGKFARGMGAAGRRYDEMATRISMTMGGLGIQLASGFSRDGKETWQKMIFRMRTLHRNIPEAVDLLGDILATGDLSDRRRMEDLVLEKRNGLQAAVVPSGHLFAQRTAASSLNLASHRDEQWNGRLQLRLLSGLSEGFAADPLVETMERLKKLVFRRGGLLFNVTGDAAGINLLLTQVGPLMERIGDAAPGGVTASMRPEPAQLGISIAAQVCYVAQVAAAPGYFDPSSAALSVVSRELSKGYLYNRIRVQGGAYGGMSLYDPLGRLFSFLSYRDPHLSETLKVYDEAARWLLETGIGEEELEKTIIGTIGSLDRPADPSGKGYLSMIRHFTGITDDNRQAFRDRVLGLSPEELLKTVREVLIPALKASSVAVYAGEDRLARANETLQQKLVIEPLMGG
jgi:Zn-dependent M16 (insulinase) family peptidase